MHTHLSSPQASLLPRIGAFSWKALIGWCIILFDVAVLASLV